MLPPFILNLKREYQSRYSNYSVQEYIELVFRKANKQKELEKFKKYVPTRFLSPFFREDLRGIKDSIKDRRIVELADKSFQQHSYRTNKIELQEIKLKLPFYRLDNEILELHPLWFEYLVRHADEIEAFVKRNFADYLSRRNPGVKKLTDKLILPNSYRQKSEADIEIISTLQSKKQIASSLNLRVTPSKKKRQTPRKKLGSPLQNTDDRNLQIPDDSFLNVSIISHLFQNTTTSYKHFWFLALLDYIRDNESIEVKISEIMIRVIQHVWHPVVTFKLSLGRHDMLDSFVLDLRKRYLSGLPNIEDKGLIRRALDLPENREKLGSFQRYVPTRFLSPFFQSMLRDVKDSSRDKKIRVLADRSFNRIFVSTDGNIKSRKTRNFRNSPLNLPFYRFRQDTLQFHPLWFNYLKRNNKVLVRFVKWELARYIGRRNIGVTGIENKLGPPEDHNPTSAREFWEVALPQMELPRCIYSGIKLKKVESLVHFVPWSAIGYNITWNTTPTLQKIYLNKGTCLPSLELHLDDFVNMQYDALTTVDKSSGLQALEEYADLLKLKRIEDLRGVSRSSFTEILKEAIVPRYLIAKHMGYTSNWKYRE